MSDDVRAAAEYIRRGTPLRPRAALVLGSGLGEFAETLRDGVTFRSSDIPDYPLSTVEGHKGSVVLGNVGNLPLLCFQGRTHFYETRNVAGVLFPVRLAHELQTQLFVVTNAGGGVNRQLEPGDLMAISDQVDLTGIRMEEALPPAFIHGPVFDRELIARLEYVAARLGIRITRGIYVGVRGPSYETAAEIEMITRLRGDAVGMSTVLETAAAARFGMRVLGISCITNKATGLSPHRLHHTEVTEVANAIKTDFSRLISGFLLDYDGANPDDRPHPRTPSR
jgi:purine-nucleoside phosphorylase